MKCYRKNGSDWPRIRVSRLFGRPSMKCYRKNGSDPFAWDEEGEDD